MSNAALPVEPGKNQDQGAHSKENVRSVEILSTGGPANSLLTWISMGAGLLSLTMLTLAEFISLRGWDFDDAMIVYRMVGNILHKGIWAYNIGEQHNPSTSILNPILIASIAKTGVTIPLASHILGATCVLISGILTVLLLAKQPVALRVLAGYTVALLLARNSSIGLETNLFACGLLLLMFFEQKNRSSWLLIGILALIRPDALLLVPVKLALDYGRRPFSIKRLALVAVPLAPWILFSLVEFGKPFPDTLSNKIWQGSSGYWGQGWIYLKGGWKHIEAASWISQVSYVVAPLGVWYALRDRSPLRLLIAFCVIRETAYAFLNVPGYHWYYANDDLCALLCGWVVVAKMVKVSTGWIVPAPAYQRLLALGSMFLLTAYSGYTLWQAEAAPRIDPRNEAYKKAISAVLTKFPDATTLAALEVGTPGYYATNMAMVDLIGLASSNHEYITGRYNDEFFENPPEVVMLHNPIWHFERALTEDLRFNLFYEDPQPVDDPSMPMQFYALRSSSGDSLTGGTEGIEGFVRNRYTPLQALTDLNPVHSDESALCIIDQVNGILNSSEPIRAKHILSVRGWAVDTKNNLTSETGTEVLLLDPATLVPRFALPIARHERTDVATHLNNPSFTRAGIDGKGHVVDVPPGLYTLAIKQGVTPELPAIKDPIVCMTRNQVEVVK
jgi:hypothetical protein